MQKLVFSSASAAIVSVFFVVVITIWAELSVPLKNWLTNFSGHHWTSKSVLSIVLYAAVTIGILLLPSQVGDRRLRSVLALLLLATVLGVLSLTFFFSGHYFHFF